jgi:hypothetical protein
MLLHQPCLEFEEIIRFAFGTGRSKAGVRGNQRPSVSRAKILQEA